MIFPELSPGETHGTGKMSVLGWGMKKLPASSCPSKRFDCAQVFGIHMTFASGTKDEIITIIKLTAGKHRKSVI